jgi:hypothetical protein
LNPEGEPAQREVPPPSTLSPVFQVSGFASVFFALDPRALSTYAPPAHMKKDAMKISLERFGLFLLAAGLFAVTSLPGCGGTADNPADELDGSFTGVYTQPADVVTVVTNSGPGGTVTMTTNIAVVAGVIVTTNSGTPVTQFNITQAQSALRAVDNAGNVFTGSFSIAYAYGGLVQMDGQTGAGVPVHIAGYMESSGPSAWINATWIEPTLQSALYAAAQVTPFSPSNSAVWKP